VKQLYPGLVKGAEGMPEIGDSSCAPKVFKALPWATWKEAKLLPAIRYVHGNRHLKVPQKWIEVFPQPFSEP